MLDLSLWCSLVPLLFDHFPLVSSAPPLLPFSPSRCAVKNLYYFLSLSFLHTLSIFGATMLLVCFYTIYFDTWAWFIGKSACWLWQVERSPLWLILREKRGWLPSCFEENDRSLVTIRVSMTHLCPSLFVCPFFFSMAASMGTDGVIYSRCLSLSCTKTAVTQIEFQRGNHPLFLSFCFFPSHSPLYITADSTCLWTSTVSMEVDRKKQTRRVPLKERTKKKTGLINAPFILLDLLSDRTKKK